MASNANETSSMVAAVHRVWDRIDGDWPSLVPAEMPLPSGASDEDLARLRGVLRCPLPDRVEATLRRHDGTPSGLDELPEHLSCTGIADAYQRLTSGVQGVASDRVVFRSEWLPIEACGGGFTVIDTTTDEGLLRFLHIEEAEPSVLEETYIQRLEEAARAVHELLPPTRMQAGGREWATTLVAVLVAEGRLELRGPASPIARAIEDCVLRDVGRPRTSKEVAEDVLELLIDDDRIEEVHASADEILAALRGLDM